jgi:hypothetical protein
MANDEFKHLEALGEEEVRRRVAKGDYGTPGSQRRSLVELWLRSKDESRKGASESRKETREEESISIAREANSIARNARFVARRANTIAIIAMILSAIIAIVAASDKVILFLPWLGILKP